MGPDKIQEGGDFQFVRGVAVLHQTHVPIKQGEAPGLVVFHERFNIVLHVIEDAVPV